MSNKTLAAVLIVVGVLIIIVALFAHALGLSSSAVLSWKKELLAAVGLVIGLIGVWMLAFKKS